MANPLIDVLIALDYWCQDELQESLNEILDFAPYRWPSPDLAQVAVRLIVEGY